MYISIAECGLTEAQAFIKALTELQAESPERLRDRVGRTAFRANQRGRKRTERTWARFAPAGASHFDPRGNLPFSLLP